jgi:hypothetical protein
MIAPLPADAPGESSPPTPTAHERGKALLVMTPEARNSLGNLFPKFAGVVDEVLLAPDRRTGFAAARGNCVVMIYDASGLDPVGIERFVTALRSGCEG